MPQPIARLCRLSISLGALLLCPLNGLAAPIEPVIAIDIEGAERSRRSWLISYLGLKAPPFPRPTPDDLVAYSQKLTTTEVFTTARVFLRPANPEGTAQRLVIEVDEKWTTIPVIRGAYGGGTPLRVLGVYDTHGFGRLHTYGAELQQYGNAKPGWVAWFRAPRWRDGRYTIGVELWQERRLRDLYDSKQRIVGQYATRANKLRLLYEQPILEQSQHKLGLDLWWQQLGEESFTPESATGGGGKITDPQQLEAALGITPLTESATLANLALRYVYDDVLKDHFDIDGTRALCLWGFIKYQSQLYNYFQGEVFHYVKLNGGSVLAFHGKGRLSESTRYPSQMFLGGFDSVRGYKDGFKYSPKAGYLNLEYRHILAKNGRFHAQGLVFTDAGYAADIGEQKPALTARSGRLQSVGLGLRVSYPKVNRLILRFDIAKALTHDQNYGIALGLNQFFQPHKPL